MTTAVYPGTFDPVHYGHIDIARRAAAIVDRLVIAVYSRPLKALLFPTEARVAMMKEAVADLDNVQVEGYSGLTVDYATRVGAEFIVRGLRVISDFELEYQMALTNRKLASHIDMVCLMTSHEYAFLSSSIVKEVAMAGGCVEQMVPPESCVRWREDSGRWAKTRTLRSGLFRYVIELLVLARRLYPWGLLKGGNENRHPLLGGSAGRVAEPGNPHSFLRQDRC